MSSNRHRPSFAIPVTPEWQPLLDHLESMENHHARSEWLRNAAWMRMLMERGLLAMDLTPIQTAAPPVMAAPPSAASTPAPVPQSSRPASPRPVSVSTTPAASTSGELGRTTPKAAMPPATMEVGDTVVEGLSPDALRGLRRVAGG